MVFIDGIDEYVHVDMLEDWLADDVAEGNGVPRIYGTTTTELSFDAGSLVEDACEDLHEEAGDNISNDEIKELQALLDAWAEKVDRGTKTYWADWSVGVILTESIKKEYDSVPE